MSGIEKTIIAVTAIVCFTAIALLRVLPDVVYSYAFGALTGLLLPSPLMTKAKARELVRLASMRPPRFPDENDS